MATTPDGKSNHRPPSSGAKKPTTIDLDSNEVAESPSSEGKVDDDTKNTSNKSSTTPSIGAAPKSDNTTPEISAAKSSASKSETNFEQKPASPASAKSDDPKKPSKTDKTTPSSPKATSKKSGNKIGVGKLFVASIVGGLVAIGGAGALQYWGVFPNLGKVPLPPPVERVDLTPLQAKIAELQSEIENNTAQVPAVDLTPVETRIATLEAASKSSLAIENASAEIANQLEQVKTELDALRASAGELTTRLDDVGASIPDQTATRNLVDTSIRPLVNASRKNSAKLEELETRFTDLTTMMDEDINARIDKFDEQLKNAATGEKLAKSVAVNALKFAIENGDPYSAALTSVETLTGTSKPLELLKPSALTGIVTAKVLLAEFHEMQSSMLLAANSNPDAGVAERLMSSIKSLVTVSSSEALSGNSPEAIISRIDANLKSGNFAQAIDEWNTLPDPVKQVSSSWAKRLGMRKDAEEQMLQLIQMILSPVKQTNG